MRAPVYQRMLQHEFSRPRNKDLMSDVYDSPSWKEFMGAAVYPNNRIGLQFCVDGIPAFSANTLSLKPAEFVNLSLPPTERGKLENILLLMLLPNSMKGDQSKKYYDFAAKHELNDLFHTGYHNQPPTLTTHHPSSPPIHPSSSPSHPPSPIHPPRYQRRQG